MSHAHSHPSEVSRKLTIASIATLLFVVIELSVGLWANSLALMGDALHNFTDTLALLIALLAVRFEKKPPTTTKTYGYHRAGVLAAFINAGTLLAFTVFIVVEAIQRFRIPHTVDSTAMLITAAIALLLNVGITLSLREEGRTDLNIRSAVVHMVGDAVSSAGIIVAALLIRSTHSTLWDPAVSLLIAALILWSSYGILDEAVNLLLEGTPRGIDSDEVTRALARINGVLGVHHLHIWALAPSRAALSCHLIVGDVPVRSTRKLLDEVTEMLEHEFHIVHATVQFEFASCDVDDPYCVPAEPAELSARSSRLSGDPPES